jgi:hypothetical protein
MRLAVCLLATMACGGPARPRDVRASVRDGAIEISWSSSALVAAHRLQLLDLDGAAPVSAAVIVEGSRAVLRGAASGVSVEAMPGGKTVAVVGAGAQGGSGASWQIFAPWDFHDGELAASYGQLAPGERLAVLLVNHGGRDGAAAEVQVDGASSSDALPQSLRAEASAAPPPSAAPHELVHAREAGLALEHAAPAEAVESDLRRSFCVVPGLDFSRHVRKPATLLSSTPHADIYADDEDLGEYEGPALQPLAQALEDQVWPAIHRSFGDPTDVDGNGKVTVLLTHELGPHLKGGWLIGYFGNADLVRARDQSPDCSGSGSNHGEIVYLNDPRNGAANGYLASSLFAAVYPATVAHEMQHLINFGRRCVQRSCSGPEETWINEALSKVAEDLAGFGWNGPGGRAEGAAYLRRGEGDLRGYDGRSLTAWEGDPIGNYQGVHSFLRLFTDRFGAGLPARIVSGSGGAAALEEALGLPLPMAMAQWATALLLSNEPGSPYSFSGSPWSPLHDRLRHLDTRSPGPLSLRHDGIAAVMSGAGLGGPAQVTVRTAESTPPYVVVVKTSAALPAR